MGYRGLIGTWPRRQNRTCPSQCLTRAGQREREQFLDIPLTGFRHWGLSSHNVILDPPVPGRSIGYPPMGVSHGVSDYSV